MSYFLKDFAVALALALTAQTKVQVVYGDEGFARSFETGPHVQVLEDPAGDVFTKAPTTQTGVQPSRFRKQVGVLIKVKGASTKSGATLADHRGVVDALADLIVIATEEISHQYKQTIGDFAGATIDDQSDGAGANPAFASYELKFKWLRGVNKAKALTNFAASFDNGVIAHRMVIPTTDGAAITAKVVDTVTVGGLAGIDASFVGKTLTLDGGASEGNRGDFPIVTVLDDSSVQITNANASVDTGLSWAVSDDEPAQES